MKKKIYFWDPREEDMLKIHFIYMNYMILTPNKAHNEYLSVAK